MKQRAAASPTSFLNREEAMTEKSENDQSKNSNDKNTQNIKTVFSSDLLGGEKMIIIRHEQENYRLKVTAAGKLILTK
jgi:hemin uptake protein HemP